jgi:hypothetical protein
MKNFEGRNNPRNDHSEEKCYRTHRNEPYFYLSPLKLEIMMERPVQLHLYHSVLTSKDINQIKEYTELMVRHISNKVLGLFKQNYYNHSYENILLRNLYSFRMIPMRMREHLKMV